MGTGSTRGTLHHGQRVCYQDWGGPYNGGVFPRKADREDLGTVEVVPAEQTHGDGPAYSVLWDTGDADPITETGWCELYNYRVLPVKESIMARTPEDLYALMDDMPWPNRWVRRSWWDAVRPVTQSKLHGDLLARIYLNGSGTDDELRFIVWHRKADREYGGIPCPDCRGAGRVQRKPRRMRSHFRVNASPDCVEEPGADGLLPCTRRDCRKGLIPARYGASNDFIHVPGLDYLRGSAGPLRDLGARGLPHPTRGHLQLIRDWCDEMIERIYRDGETP